MYTPLVVGILLASCAQPQDADLVSAGETAMEIVRTTKDPDAKWRAIRILGSIRHQRAIPLLIAQLEGEHVYVRSNAARALGDMRASSAAKPLIHLLKKEKNGGVIQQASLALGNLDAKEAVPTLKEAVSHEDVQTRIWVLQAITRLDGKREIAFVAKFLEDPSTNVQGSAAEFLEQITGIDFGTPKKQGPASYEPAIQRARKWWAENKSKFTN